MDTVATVSVLRASERAVTPWRNGGGITREIAVAPAGAGIADFDWRVSMAQVSAAGPFSCFEDIDRVLTVLAGTLRLTVQGQPVCVDSNTAPTAFPGDAACWGAPQDGPVTDLNVMVRRGRYAARVSRAEAGDFAVSADIWFFVALAAGTATMNGESHTLNLYDAIQVRDRSHHAVTTSSPGIVIELEALA